MTTREIIQAIKARIKEMAAAQKADKLKRKGCPADKMPALWGYILCRSARITAHLNCYLALRGRDYRHGIVNERLNRRYSDEVMKDFELAVRT